ncbi:MAG: hypothetical protein IRD7MM_01680 [Candidatus Midichloria mitochondrii]|nr:septal ring lytic transglycosylase RlpA family protein [Candidatus Midichloria mitochondrii]
MGLFLIKIYIPQPIESLSFRSLIRVTNLQNGKQTVLIVNDGRPVPKDRILDVPEQAAESLGFKCIGLAKVKVEYLPHHSKKLLENVKSDKCSVICN